MTKQIDAFLDCISERGYSVLIKRMSANDTGATLAHQAGPYIPKEVAFALSPGLRAGTSNPDQFYECNVVSHSTTRVNRLVWYNSGSRDECRITNWATKGQKNSVIRVSQTGGIVVLAFATSDLLGIEHGCAWFCETETDEEVVESRFGIIEPGTFVFRHKGVTSVQKSKATKTNPCNLTADRLPENWLSLFPDASEILRKTIELMPANTRLADERLLSRRDCEYLIFKSVEQVHVMPKISRGFTSVDAFVDLANAVTNRRKARSGRSLELHLRQIFDESGLKYSHGAQTEGKKTPDFLFPSVDCYHDHTFPTEKLKMLGVKTTCKDRWRQVISEADRLPVKHLATLQEGVSEPQFDEMEKAGIVLVVPKSLHVTYPKPVRPKLLSLERFIEEARIDASQ